MRICDKKSTNPSFRAAAYTGEPHLTGVRSGSKKHDFAPLSAATPLSAVRGGAMPVVRVTGHGVVQMRAVHMAVARRHHRAARRAVIIRRRTGCAIIVRRSVAGRRARHTSGTRAAHVDADRHAGFRAIAASHHESHQGKQEGKENLFHGRKRGEDGEEEPRRAPLHLYKRTRIVELFII